jgi:hypothetical protein
VGFLELDRGRKKGLFGVVKKEKSEVSCCVGVMWTVPMNCNRS